MAEEVSAASIHEQTMPVYRDGSLCHLPGANPGTPYTACGLDAGAMMREDRPITWAALWCTACMKGASDADE